jgi:pimeloyl-ACP methyl ester carboxylesterase
MSESPTVVLVHGAFVDGAGWRGVYDLLRADGTEVRVTQHSTQSLDGDVAAVHLVLDQLDGPAILVGHSYGGVIITEAGTHEKVAGLVYVAAFAPDDGESVNSLLAGTPPDAPVPPIVPVSDTNLALDRAQFAEAFAADVDAADAAFLADSQPPWGVAALGGEISDAAWKQKPSWYVLATEDRMIPPAAQQGMSARAGATVTEVAASHSVFLSKPDVVADVIRQAIAGSSD